MTVTKGDEGFMSPFPSARGAAPGPTVGCALRKNFPRGPRRFCTPDLLLLRATLCGTSDRNGSTMRASGAD